jgi:hypothetical protein
MRSGRVPCNNVLESGALAAPSRSELDEFRDLLTSDDLVQLYDYWRARRGSGAMPSRKDIDPLDLRRHLPKLMLMEVLDEPFRVRYRLVGTDVVAATGEDRTGRISDTVAFFGEHPDVLGNYETVVRARAPKLVREPFRNPKNNTTYESDTLMLPLSADGERVNMLLVYFQFLTGPYRDA